MRKKKSKHCSGVNECLQIMFARRCAKKMPEKQPHQLQNEQPQTKNEQPQTKNEQPKKKESTTKKTKRKWKHHEFIYSSNDSDFAECSLVSQDTQNDASPSPLPFSADGSPIVVAIPSDEDPDSDETVISPSFAQESQESQEGPALTFAQPDPETPPASSSDSQVRGI